MIPANFRMIFTYTETRMIVLPHDRILIRLDKSPEPDGQTDRNAVLLQCLHCEQCGRALKNERCSAKPVIQNTVFGNCRDVYFTLLMIGRSRLFSSLAESRTEQESE